MIRNNSTRWRPVVARWRTVAARRLPVVLAFFAVFPLRIAVAQRPLNLDMEQRSVVMPHKPWGWYLSDQNAPEAERQAVLDSTVRHDGRHSVRVVRQTAAAPAWFGGSYLAAQQLVGKRLRLSGWVRTDTLEEGHATLRVEILGRGYVPIAIDSMAGRGVQGTTSWTRVSLTLTVDTGALALGIGMQMSGRGTAWFDGLVLEVAGKRITEEPGPPAITTVQAAWVQSRAHPLTSVTPGGNDTDLALLRDLIGRARIVSLGEATHGTREFYQLKHRLIEHLVRRLGFSVVMLEANQLQAERLNRYVLTGEGDVRAALAGLFRILQTEEVLDLVEWARAYNAAGKGRVEIVGYDMQNPSLAIDSVLAFLSRRDTAFHASAVDAYRAMAEAWRPGGYPPRPDSVVRTWREQSERVRRHMRSREVDYYATARTRADSVEVAWALQNAEVTFQSASLGDESPNSVRDSAMAANIAWALGQRPAGTRAVVWAHNIHVSRTPEWMGDYLERLFPGQVSVFGMTTAGGEYVAAADLRPDVKNRIHGSFAITPTTPPRSSVAHVLSRLSYPIVLVDLREARSDKEAQWLRDPRPALFLGAAAADYAYVVEKAADVYDFLFFVRSTTPTRPLK